MNILSEKEFKEFKEKIHKISGLNFSHINRPILESRINLQLKKHKLRSAHEYLQLINSNKQELNLFLDALTTNLTSFFRNKDHFKLLKLKILPEIIKNKNSNNKIIKIWSAACSTGEEVYSILMILLEHFYEITKTWNIDILATDISFNSLEIAKKGFYSKQKLENLNKYFIEKYFKKVEDGFLFQKEGRNFIRFNHHNLQKDNNERNVDIIFCNNVLIYFDRSVQIKVINLLAKCSIKKGYLFLGHSESIFGYQTSYSLQNYENVFVYQLSK